MTTSATAKPTCPLCGAELARYQLDGITILSCVASVGAFDDDRAREVDFWTQPEPHFISRKIERGAQ